MWTDKEAYASTDDFLTICRLPAGRGPLPPPFYFLFSPILLPGTIDLALFLGDCHSRSSADLQSRTPAPHNWVVAGKQAGTAAVRGSLVDAEEVGRAKVHEG